MSCATTPVSSSLGATAAATREHIGARRSRTGKRLPTIELAPHEQAEYDRVVGRLLFSTVREYTAFLDNDAHVDRADWSLVRRNDGMAIYRHRHAQTQQTRASLMLGVGTIDGSLEDVMDGLYSDSCEDLQSVLAFLQSKAIAATVLQTSETRSPDDPFTFAGVKWMATKMPDGFTVHDRDLLYYERQGTTFDADGTEVAYHLMHSIDRPEVPPGTIKGLVRASSSICYLYKRRGHRVETFFRGEVTAGGSLPHRLLDYSVAGKWLSVRNAVQCSEARKLSQLRAHARSKRNNGASITLSDIDRCHLCASRRSLFSRQHLCGGCSENVCRSCSTTKQLFELDDRGRPLRDRFCHKCLVDVALQRGSRIAECAPASRSIGTVAPAYFRYAFHLCGVRPRARTATAANSSNTTILRQHMWPTGPVPSHTPAPAARPKGVLVDTSYVDALLQQQRPPRVVTPRVVTPRSSEHESDAKWSSVERRRRSYFETLNSTSPASRAQLVYALFAAPSPKA